VIWSFGQRDDLTRLTHHPMLEPVSPRPAPAEVGASTS
jgi:hypothetical protein